MVGPAILLGLLLLGLLYAVPIALLVLGLRNLLRGRPRRKSATAAIQLSIGVGLLIYFSINRYRAHEAEEAEQLGSYELVQYPACYPCTLELQEDNVFVVKNGDIIKETGQWRFESGQDYWITFLNEHDRLGSGKYAYGTYKLRHLRTP